MKDIKKISDLNNRISEALIKGNDFVNKVNEGITKKQEEIVDLQIEGNHAVTIREVTVNKIIEEKQEHFNKLLRKFSAYARQNGGEVFMKDVENIYSFMDFLSKTEEDPKKFKVALMFICLNEPYWQYAKNAIEGARKYFLPGHDLDMFLWSDMPEDMHYGAKVFHIEPMQWPMPTLMRYHIFLRQEEVLKNYDYIFYCDIDMLWNDIVGDEVLGTGLTAAPHPGYYLRKEWRAPFDPNPNSAAYVKQQGVFVSEKEFMPTYSAGGFQGGTAESFIKAMKEMKKGIDDDFAKGYTARWNDESHWNKYLIDNPPSVFLNPAYVYPDSLINEYYVPLWGRNFHPRLITLTKPFTVSKEAGEHIKGQLDTLQGLK